MINNINQRIELAFQILMNFDCLKSIATYQESRHAAASVLVTGMKFDDKLQAYMLMWSLIRIACYMSRMYV